MEQNRITYYVHHLNVMGNASESDTFADNCDKAIALFRKAAKCAEDYQNAYSDYLDACSIDVVEADGKVEALSKESSRLYAEALVAYKAIAFGVRT